MMETLILIIAAFITSSISAVLGMGGGIILLGLMAIIIPEGYMVIALHGIIQLVSNTTRTYVFRAHLKKYIIKEFGMGAIIGLSISAFIIFILVQLFNVDSANEIKVDFLKPIIGLFIIWYLFLKGPKKEKHAKSFIGVGALSGVSSVFVGATGPLIAPFFLGAKLTKENIIANKAACQMISHLGKIPLFIIFFQFYYVQSYDLLLPMVVAVFLGTNVGKKILNFIPEAMFRQLFRLALFFIAIRLIVAEFI
ncbi:MAG: sulfite exporter TauE/SafE family protein [Candidatus Marinimicrobia bacterium]|nr:sulfite exporter TauE/SafE family protein [Candidatus Neomarinimicrobiota bacterium]